MTQRSDRTAGRSTVDSEVERAPRASFGLRVAALAGLVIATGGGIVSASPVDPVSGDSRTVLTDWPLGSTCCIEDTEPQDAHNG